MDLRGMGLVLFFCVDLEFWISDTLFGAETCVSKQHKNTFSIGAIFD